MGDVIEFKPKGTADAAGDARNDAGDASDVSRLEVSAHKCEGVHGHAVHPDLLPALGPVRVIPPLPGAEAPWLLGFDSAKGPVPLGRILWFGDMEPGSEDVDDDGREFCTMTEHDNPPGELESFVRAHVGTTHRALARPEPLPVEAYMLDNVFTYHAPRPDQLPRYNVLRQKAKEFVQLMLQITPMCLDQQEAIKHVRSAVMFANAAIALESVPALTDSERAAATHLLQEVGPSAE